MDTTKSATNQEKPRTNDRIQPGTALAVLVILFTLASIGYRKMTQAAQNMDRFDRCVEFSKSIGNPFEGAEYVKSVCNNIEGR